MPKPTAMTTPRALNRMVFFRERALVDDGVNVSVELTEIPHLCIALVYYRVAVASRAWFLSLELHHFPTQLFAEMAIVRNIQNSAAKVSKCLFEFLNTRKVKVVSWLVEH